MKIRIIKLFQAIVFSLLAYQVNCQLSQVTYGVNSDTLSVEHYNNDRAT